MKKLIFISIFLFLSVGLLNSQFTILEDEKEIWDLKIKIIKEKLDRFLLPAMREYNIDMWIVMSRENNRDPILPDIGGGIGGGRNAYVFIDDGTDRLKRYAIGGALGDIMQTEIYDEVITGNTRTHLKNLVEKYDPEKIGVNISDSVPMCDGLSVALKRYLENSIGDKYAKRLVSAEKVVVSFRAHRTEDEVEIMKTSFNIARRIHHEVLSEKYIVPGKTTAADLFWTYRQKVREYKVKPGWPGSCPYELFRGINGRWFWRHEGETLLEKIVLQPGDFIDVNFGVDYLGYCSDINRQVYLLKPGEKEAPEEIQKLFEESLIIQEQLKNNMQAGLTGAEVAEKTMSWYKNNGYKCRIYAHSIGNTVHGIGPFISSSPRLRAQTKLDPLMLFAVEVGIAGYSEALGDSLCFVRQDDAVLTENGMKYLGELQKEIILVKSK